MRQTVPLRTPVTQTRWLLTAALYRIRGCVEGRNVGAWQRPAAEEGWACLCQPCDSGWREGVVLASHASSCWSGTCVEQPGNCGRACMHEDGVRRRGARCLAGRSTDHSLHAAVTCGGCGVTLGLPSANTAGCKSIIWGVWGAFLSFCPPALSNFPALYVLLLFPWNDKVKVLALYFKKRFFFRQISLHIIAVISPYACRRSKSRVLFSGGK